MQPIRPYGLIRLYQGVFDISQIPNAKVTQMVYFPMNHYFTLKSVILSNKPTAKSPDLPLLAPQI